MYSAVGSDGVRGFKMCAAGVIECLPSPSTLAACHDVNRSKPKCSK